MPNELDAAVSDEILRPVSQQTGETLFFLQKSIKVTPVRGTDYIKFTAHHEDRSAAVLIANTMAEIYVNKKKKRQDSRWKKYLEVLRKDLLKQEQLIKQSTDEQQREARIIRDRILKIHKEASIDVVTAHYPATIHERVE